MLLPRCPGEWRRSRGTPAPPVANERIRSGSTRTTVAERVRTMMRRVRETRMNASLPLGNPDDWSVPVLDERVAVGVVNEALKKGNIPLANYVVRAALGARPQSAPLRFLLASIAAAVGRLDEARGILEALVRESPDFEVARLELEGLRDEVDPSPSPRASSERFLVIRAWGFGFWSDVSHVLGQLLLARLTHRTPIVHWGSESRYSDGRGETFRRFFLPVSETSIEDLPTDPDAYFPPKWSRSTLEGPDRAKFEGEWSRMDAVYFVERSEAVAVSDFYTAVAGILPWVPATDPLHARSPVEVVRDLAAVHLRPVEEVLERVESFANSGLAGRRWVAAHLRGSDKMLESADLALVNDEIMTEVDRSIDQDPEMGILLIVDDARWLSRAKARWGDRMRATDVLRTSGDVGVHHLPGLDPIRLGREVLIDALLAARCDRFVGNGQSNVAAMIACLKAWPEGTCRLVRPSLLEHPNIFLHLPKPR